MSLNLGAARLCTIPKYLPSSMIWCKKEKSAARSGRSRRHPAKIRAAEPSIPVLALANGDEARYCSPSEMPLIRAAYQEFILAKVHEQLKSYHLKVFAQIGGDNEVVFGQKSKPVKAVIDGKTVIVRDSLFGSFTGCNVDFLQGALQVFDVVCLTPPIYDRELSEYINIDADMLAAHLATELGAEHLRFITGTAGLLQNVDEPASTISDVYLGDEIHSIKGRMKQKVRAANHAISKGICDVSITGPHSLNRPGTGKTWFWNIHRDAVGRICLEKRFEFHRFPVTSPSLRAIC